MLSLIFNKVRTKIFVILLFLSMLQFILFGTQHKYKEINGKSQPHYGEKHNGLQIFPLGNNI
jgi:hypothetical protein